MWTRHGVWLAGGVLALAALGAVRAQVEKGGNVEKAGQVEKAAAGAEPSEDKVPAANDPDKFAWDLFLEICRPAGAGTRDVRWEMWAEEDNIFADPNTEPRWPGQKPQRQLRPSRQHELRKLQMPNLKALPDLPGDRAPGGEEVRINRHAFDYVVKNGLWYQQGVIKTAQAPTGIKFPTDSLAIKALWKVITPAEKPRYHWDEYTDPKTKKPVTVGLIALHVTSKVLPNWHWATFEQEDNPAFADEIGAHDSYGMIPAVVKPNAEPNKGYKTALKPVLLERMKKDGLSPEWTHYRLKGAQIDFTDSTGRPTILGNSITEAGFVATSSCVTCHARASAMLGGGNPPQWTTLSVFRPDGQSDNGPVNPNWFWAPGSPTPKFYQVDFLWELGFRPKYRTAK
ncbi:hypothetical protein R5W24_003109 [Gemmata sp. JC717]|uniref:hypothetical protein n=1 Tax=Gemmata algarum TaxID=2975278 RepID=UPI0021BA648F|nr:hypothetical protein [Gemmata algarum]MDY3553995.1 hypothetical protein [Gemmata algarum]